MNYNQKDVIIIRGAPGSGKSEVAKRLSKYFENGIRLEVDTLRSMVISVDWTNQVEHKQILNLATTLASGFISLGRRPVLVIDTFSGDKLSDFLADLKIANRYITTASFALVTAPDVLSERVLNRPEDRFKDVKICQKINADTIRYLLPQEILIDNTDLSPDETAEQILQRLGDGQLLSNVGKTMYQKDSLVEEFGPLVDKFYQSFKMHLEVVVIEGVYWLTKGEGNGIRMGKELNEVKSHLEVLLTMPQHGFTRFYENTATENDFPELRYRLCPSSKCNPCEILV